MKLRSRGYSMLIMIIIIICLFIHPAPLAVGSVEHPADIQRIIQRGKLVVGLYFQDMPPFFMEDEKGELSGLDIELAREIADTLEVGLEFNREAESYQELFEKVARGEVDVVIAKFSMTFSRALSILYTKPYVTFRWALMVNSEFATREGITDYPMTFLRDVGGIRVGVRAKTSYVEFAERLFENAEIVQYEIWDEVVSALRQGEVVAALYDENEVIKSLYQNPDIAIFSSIYILEDQKDHIAMAVHPTSTQLLSWLNFYLENYEISYSVSDLVAKYPEQYK